MSSANIRRVAEIKLQASLFSYNLRRFCILVECICVPFFNCAAFSRIYNAGWCYHCSERRVSVPLKIMASQQLHCLAGSCPVQHLCNVLALVVQ